MNKKTIIVSSVIILFFIGAFLLFANMDKLENDASRFKKEYEALNNTVRESDGEKYNNVEILKDNPIKYVDSKEAVEVLNSKEAIIYVGAEWCPWCRSAVPVLFDVAKENKIETIYYLNLDSEKSSYEIKDGKLVNTKKGSKDYYVLLDKLSEYLDDYILTDENGKKYDTKEKRIYMPYVIGVKDGKIVSDHVGTVSLNAEQNKYDKLTTEQIKELHNTYDNLFQKVFGKNNQTCTSDNCE